MSDVSNHIEDRITRQEAITASLNENVKSLTDDMREMSRTTARAIAEMGSGFRSELTSFRQSVEEGMKSVQARDNERGKGMLPMVMTLGIGGFSVFATIVTIYIAAQVNPVTTHQAGQDKSIERLENESRDARDRGIRNETLIQLMHPRIVLDPSVFTQKGTSP